MALQKRNQDLVHIEFTFGPGPDISGVQATVRYDVVETADDSVVASDVSRRVSLWAQLTPAQQTMLNTVAKALRQAVKAL